MYPVSKRKKISIGAGIFIVLFICFYVFVYEPQKKEALRLQEEIKTVDKEIDRILKAVPVLAKLEEEIRNEQKRVFLARKPMSGEQHMQELLQQLERDASRLNMKVVSLEFVKESESTKIFSNYKKLTMVINIQCPYPNLVSYLKELKNLPGLPVIDGLEIVKDDQIFPQVQVKLTLSTFISKMWG
jgi:hypothetical protein